MKPSLRQLQYLVAIADTGRFADAARLLNVSQPSLSTQVAEAEAQLGAVVFERGRKGAIATPLGEQIIARARYVLRQMEDLKALASHGGSGLYGRIRLGVLPTVGPYLLPRCTKLLHSRFPDLRLSIRDEPTSDLSRSLEGGLFDAVISTPGDHPGCEGEHLFEEGLWIAVEPQDELARTDEPVTVQELAGRPFLTLGLGHRLTLLVQELAHRAGAFVSADYEGTSLDAIRHMAALGAGIAILPELYVKCEAAKDRNLHFRRIDDPDARRRVSLIWRQGSPLDTGLVQIAAVMRRAAESSLR